MTEAGVDRNVSDLVFECFCKAHVVVIKEPTKHSALLLKPHPSIFRMSNNVSLV